MGERIEQLRLSAFRGVPDELEIQLEGGRSLVVYGDNGTGKSTLADALEWYFTGQIELLAHEGRQHAVRNLGAAKDRTTTVELVTDGELSGLAEYPNGGNDRAREAAGSETFLLRGRTLADFINKTKTEKWRALAEILGLEEIERLRQDLQRVRTDLRKRAKTAEEELRSCREALAPRDGELDEDRILAGLQEICRGLGMEAPASLAQVGDPSWQMAFAARQAGKPGADQRTTILREIETLAPPALDATAVADWNGRVASETLAHLRLLSGAQTLLSAPEHAAGECPLCGQETPGIDLAARIRDALESLAHEADAITAARGVVEEQLHLLAAAAEQRESLRLRGRLLGLALPETPAAPAAELEACLDAEQPLPGETLEQVLAGLESWDEAARAIAAGAAQAAGESRDATAQQLEMLAILCRQIDQWHGAEQRVRQATRARDLADQVFAGYQKRQQEYLSGILDRINARVAEIYDSLHPGEGLGGVTVEPWTAKGVELAIVFHGSRQRPPHGVLSESHLNSLAIALFLAMADTFNERLGFLVLDDVINSFDSEHRGSLARLLATRDDRQMIVLTHDHQFYEHLTRRAPAWQRLELLSWSYEEGPRTAAYRGTSALDEARRYLEAGDVNGAATKARRILEAQLQEVCEALRALLPFRRGTGNDRRELGELFQGVRRALKQHAKPLLDELQPLLRDLEADVGATLNVEAHASQGRAAAPEVAAALDRIDALDRKWTCASCATRIWWKGTPESARCQCGASRFPPLPAA